MSRTDFWAKNSKTPLLQCTEYDWVHWGHSNRLNECDVTAVCVHIHTSYGSLRYTLVYKSMLATNTCANSSKLNGIVP